MDQSKQYFKRSSGVLLPVSSLPSPYGIGGFGRDARLWAEFLGEAGQSFWQILPLSPADGSGSPYQSVSAFAGDGNYIDLETLCCEGFLDPADYTGVKWSDSGQRVDYGSLDILRAPLLGKAFSRFKETGAPGISTLDSFISRNSWVDDYCLYMAIKAAHGGRPWFEWEEPLRARQRGALDEIRVSYAEDYRYHAFIQYQHRRQWKTLREYANSRGIRVIGDVPIYVALDSADVWANPALFQLDEKGLPTEVAGYPPDALSDYGQLWGNPLYNWNVMAQNGYRWWTERLRSSFGLYDVVRIDHFRGLESYFAIPSGTVPAAGQWKKGPGEEFIDAVKRALPDACFIAEDLGAPSEAVDRLLEYSGFPGMKVLQFAFDPLGDKENRPYKYPRNTVVYPGTHDNDTVKGWAENTQELYVDHAIEYIGVRSREELPNGMIRVAMQSAADLAIIQMQDWLGLGSEARINTPSTMGGHNWSWRLDSGALTDSLAAEMARMTATYDRG